MESQKSGGLCGVLCGEQVTASDVTSNYGRDRMTMDGGGEGRMRRWPISRQGDRLCCSS